MKTCRSLFVRSIAIRGTWDDRQGRQELIYGSRIEETLIPHLSEDGGDGPECPSGANVACCTDARGKKAWYPKLDP